MKRKKEEAEERQRKIKEAAIVEEQCANERDGQSQEPIEHRDTEEAAEHRDTEEDLDPDQKLTSVESMSEVNWLQWSPQMYARLEDDIATLQTLPQYLRRYLLFQCR